MSTFSTHRKSGGTAAYPQIGELFQDNYSLLFEGEQEAEFDQDILDIGTNTNLSISYWIKCNNLDSRQYVISGAANLFGQRMDASLNVANKPQFTLALNIMTSVSQISNTEIDDDSWHHVLWSHDRDGASVIYIDGSEDDSEALTDNSSSNVDISGAGYVGRNAWSALESYKLHGYVNDIAIWNEALSAADASAIYSSGTPNDLTNSASYHTDRTSNLLVYWRMEENTGTTIADESGNGITLSFGSGGAAPSWSSETP